MFGQMLDFTEEPGRKKKGEDARYQDIVRNGKDFVQTVVLSTEGFRIRLRMNLSQNKISQSALSVLASPTDASTTGAASRVVPSLSRLEQLDMKMPEMPKFEMPRMPWAVRVRRDEEYTGGVEGGAEDGIVVVM
eukprot:750937-Hanusia_phi.AAC.6